MPEMNCDKNRRVAVKLNPIKIGWNKKGKSNRMICKNRIFMKQIHENPNIESVSATFMAHESINLIKNRKDAQTLIVGTSGIYIRIQDVFGRIYTYL